MREHGPRFGAALRTKGEELLAAARFSIPEASARHVTREHVTRVLAGAQHLPLVVVSAPAGTGKTAAVAEWARRQAPERTGWIEFDHDETLFWPFLLEMFTRLGLAVPVGWAQADTPNLGRERLVSLTALLVDTPAPLTVVIDGYEMASVDVANEVDYMIRHSLGRFRVILVGRVDPVLPLHRYRLADSLLELRAPDLAFTQKEAEELMKAFGAELGSPAVRSLNERLHGWAAGLGFAARALVHDVEPEKHLEATIEQTADINEYLLAEVLDAQPPQVRRLLLETSVPELLTPELVELLAGGSARRALGKLATQGAFTEPVPDRPGCFRYYPFFRGLLRAQLAYESPDRMVELHRLTAGWLRSQGLHVQALAHLSDAGCWSEMASQFLEEQMIGRLLVENAEGALGRLARRLPDEVKHPAACVVRAAVALRAMDHDRCSRELTAARRRSGRLEEGGRALEVSIGALEALCASRALEVGKATERTSAADRLMRLTPVGAPGDGGTELRTLVGIASGVCALRRGDLTTAGLAFAGSALDAGPDHPAALRAEAMGYRALTHALSYELSLADLRAEELGVFATEAGLRADDLPPSLHVALALVCVERCDPDMVRLHLGNLSGSRGLLADRLGRDLAEVATAALEQPDRNGETVLTRLESASDSTAVITPWVADVLRIAAAGLATAAGRPHRALGILEAVQDAARSEVVVATSAAYTEEGGWNAASRLLDSIDPEQAPLSTRITAELLQAARESHLRSPSRAHVSLERALRLGGPERIRRPFRQAGPRVRAVLEGNGRLLERHGWLEHPSAGLWGRPGSGGEPTAMAEPLTARELEVLGLLAELLTTDEIAQTMFVSVNTVKTHTRNILRKLGANRRNAAIRRARELGILNPNRMITRVG